MGHLLVLFIAASVFVVYTNITPTAATETGVLHVGGKVLCQDCTQGWNEWVHGLPIKGAKVSVTCQDTRNRVVRYASDTTDEAGQFDVIVDEHCANGKKLNPRKCSVRLVSSPNATCNVLTDFSGGKTGVWLRGPSLVNGNLIRYTVGPFYFTSPMCEEPDTTDDDSGDDKGEGN